MAVAVSSRGYPPRRASYQSMIRCSFSSRLSSSFPFERQIDLALRSLPRLFDEAVQRPASLHESGVQRLPPRFYRSDSGREAVREWLKGAKGRRAEGAWRGYKKVVWPLKFNCFQRPKRPGLHRGGKTVPARLVDGTPPVTRLAASSRSWYTIRPASPIGAPPAQGWRRETGISAACGERHASRPTAAIHVASTGEFVIEFLAAKRSACNPHTSKTGTPLPPRAGKPPTPDPSPRMRTPAAADSSAANGN
jgi:hypothetical protein